MIPLATVDSTVSAVPRADITQYRFRYRDAATPNGAWISQITSASSVTFSGLVQGKTYDVEIYATCTAGLESAPRVGQIVA